MDILKNLNQEQEKAVTHDNGPILIVAGAGTGKTTVIARRIAWLIDSKKAKPDEILALTFTDKAAGEMEERVDKLLPYGYVDLWISTFHSFGERLLHEHALDIGVPHDFKLYSETEQWMLVRRNLDRFNLNYYRPLGNPTKFIHAMIRHFSRAKDEEIHPIDYIKYAEDRRLNGDTDKNRKAKKIKIVKKQSESLEEMGIEADRLEEVANAYHIYQQILLENNALDFGDLINYALKLFKTRPELLERYRKQFKYVLVDEFQDTNTAQYELVKLLSVPTNNLTVVGDDDQSIYRFRGASMSNILQFQKDYPSSKKIALVQNYRSTQNILDLAHSFIEQNNPNRLEFQLRQTKENPEGLSKVLKAVVDDQGLIEHICGENKEDEQGLVIEKINELKVFDDTINWGDFAILCRSNDLANEFDMALSRAGLPHQSYTSKGLYKKPIIMDTLCYFRLLDNYHESLSFWRVLNFSFWKLSGADLVTLSHFASKKSQSLYEAAINISIVPNISNEGVKTIRKILEFINSHSLLTKNDRPAELMVKALNEIGYTNYIQTLGEEKARLEFSYLNQFYQRIKRWEATQTDPRLRSFIEAITYEMESGEAGDLDIDPETGPDVIKVMTVHAAKGLEYKYIFVVGLVDRRFPTTERREPIELPKELSKEILPEGDIHLEEERRLFYVAMTRAKRGLFFTSAKDYGGARKKKPSRFLIELGIPLSKTTASKSKNSFSVLAAVNVENKNETEPLPDHFSFTAIKAFETCPWQYRYAHILRVPVWGRHTFSFGQSMHATLERFFKLLIERRNYSQVGLFANDKQKEISVPTKEELLKIFESSWIEDWYENKRAKEEYYQKGKEILKIFYDKHAGNWPKTKDIEKGFVLKIGSYSLKGKIDRIDDLESGVEIIDYKTGKVPTKNSDLEKDQLLIYHMAATELWGDKPLKLTFYYLNDNKPMSFVAEPKEIEELKGRIVETVEKIQARDFTADPSEQKCKRCDFKSICPYSKA